MSHTSCRSAQSYLVGHFILEHLGVLVRTHTLTPRNGRQMLGAKQACLPQNVSEPSENKASLQRYIIVCMIRKGIQVSNTGRQVEVQRKNKTSIPLKYKERPMKYQHSVPREQQPSKSIMINYSTLMPLLLAISNSYNVIQFI